MTTVLRAVLEMVRILVLLLLFLFVAVNIEQAIFRSVIADWDASPNYYWWMYLGNFILFFILYRNKLQFSGWYKQDSYKLSRKTTYSLFSIVLVVLLVPVLLSSCTSSQDLSLVVMSDVQDELEQIKLQVPMSETKVMSTYDAADAQIQAYELEDGELLYAYVFRSEEDCFLGKRNIQQQTALIDTVYTPYFYEAKNALFIYMKKNEGQEIERIMNELVEALA